MRPRHPKDQLKHATCPMRDGCDTLLEDRSHAQCTQIYRLKDAWGQRSPIPGLVAKVGLVHEGKREAAELAIAV